MNLYEIWHQNVSEEDKLILNSYSAEEKALYFNKNLEYGTGGIRAKMKLGHNVLNIYTIHKVALGLINFINKYYPGYSVVIGHDYRNQSLEFSETIIGILNTHQIKTYTFKDAVPTPFVSYITRKFDNVIGLNITASHNPKEYNGIKFYGIDGAQLSDEASLLLNNEINNIDDFFNLTYKIDHHNIIIGDDEYQNYFNYVLNTTIQTSLDFSNIRITYTAQHGVGGFFTEAILKHFKINYNLVSEQMIPDGNFGQTTTVNPEDIKAFDKAIENASAFDSDLIISHDPDADRMGVMIKTNQGYQLLSGNQVGAIILDYLINNSNTTDGYVVKTVVSSPLIDKMCIQNNIKCFNSLTGFKNISNYIKSEHGQLLLAFEESIGYLLKEEVRDKDGFQALIIIAEIASFLKHNNLTIEQQLDAIYQKYGYYEETTISVYDESVNGPQNIANIVDYYRNYNLPTIGEQTIIKKQDFLNMPGYSPSNFIKFVFENGFFIVRPSGTEPKLKYYFSICNRNLIAAKEQLKILKEVVVK